MVLSLLLVLAGLAGVVLAERAFLCGAVELSQRLGLPEAVIAAVVIAIGTSAPELAINLAASFRGEGDVVVGNIVGSQVFNLLGILGLGALLVPIGFSPSLIIDIAIWLLAAPCSWLRSMSILFAGSSPR